MTTLYTGAKSLPLRHLSIRVPWHDTDWTGRVCTDPANNVACLILNNIRAKRDDAAEAQIAGASWEQLSPEQLPPCVGERANFMAPYALTRYWSHPYSQTSRAHKHFLETAYRVPPYSAMCIPFRWMLRETAQEKAGVLDLGFQQELEDDAHADMGFDTSWVQTKHNQLVLLETFYSAIQPQKSLCFFYAKRTPLTDDPRRVIIGVGWVTHVGQAIDYEYSESGRHESIIWERPVQHSIRSGFQDGFLLPYRDILAYLEQHPEEDVEKYVAFAPDDQFDAFSFASEHVTNDGAIATLLACTRALDHIERVVPGNFEPVRAWIDHRLNELWQMRGPLPGLGSALIAFGIGNGTLLAYEIEKLVTEQGSSNPWQLVAQLLSAPNTMPTALKRYVPDSISRKWNALTDERKQLLLLLSRFELTPAQATRYYVHEEKERQTLGIQLSDRLILQNSYLLYETDRVAKDAINLAVIDRGVFPETYLREQHPLPDVSRIDDPMDDRRVRAFVVRELERAASKGHTLLPRSSVIQAIRELDVRPSCPVDGDQLNVAEAYFNDVVVLTRLTDGSPAYQLERFGEIRERIQSQVNRRSKGRRHVCSANWRQRLDNVLNIAIAEDDIEERRAREEKTAALAELFESRISVLAGPAGTGKTTLLKVLCRAPEIEQGGVLLLAPTGKARVRLEQQTSVAGAQTLAQFLLKFERYVPDTGAYRLSMSAKRYQGAKTVIVDEASMLTEEQLGALFDALSGVERIILVGDYRQLPPIGAGRPFRDIVDRMAPANIETQFPRVAAGYAELTILRRQISSVATRDDLLLADWFSGRSTDPGADEIWSRLLTQATSNHLKFVRWDTPEELREAMLAELVDALELQDVTDSRTFEKSLGGSPYGKHIFFWAQRDDSPGASEKIEDWQILSPVRNLPHGVEALNRLIQRQFRGNARAWATARPKYRKIPKPMGREEILYGDKVINLTNHPHHDVYPHEGALKYIANGEIGVVVGQYKTKRFKGAPKKLEVEFSSQPGYKYGFGGWAFSEESDAMLELAYALTVHKVQGSEFDMTFLVLPNPCQILSRELLYTALTRQKKRVIILHQGNVHDLKRFSGDEYSETAGRFTNLFQLPDPVDVNGRPMEKRLIHRTARGEMVRSKSEVIIANILYAQQIDYVYEQPLVGADGRIKYPDFTFEDAEMGLTYYWEHLGLLHQPAYRQRWEDKLAWYAQEGILPLEEGGGARGTLVTTRDTENGAMHADEIVALVKIILEG